MANRMVTHSITSRDLEKSCRESNMFGAHYLENGRRYRLGYNGSLTVNGTSGIE